MKDCCWLIESTVYEFHASTGRADDPSTLISLYVKRLSMKILGDSLGDNFVSISVCGELESNDEV